MPSHQLLPFSEVEKQGIQTPLQYKAAVLAAQGRTCALRRPQKLDKSRKRAPEYSSGSRFAARGCGLRRLAGSRSRGPLSKSTEQPAIDGKKRKGAHAVAMQKKQAELQRRRLPACNSIKSSKIVRCSRILDKKQKQMARGNAGFDSPEARYVAEPKGERHPVDVHTRDMRSKETTSRDAPNVQPEEQQIEGDFGSTTSADFNNRYPCSFGSAGLAQTQRGGLTHEKVVSPPGLMGSANQYTFMQKANNTKGPSPPSQFMHSDAFMFPERLQVDSMDYEDPGVREGTRNISFFNSQKFAGADQFRGQGNYEVQMIVPGQSDRYTSQDYDEKRHQSQQANPFQPQLPAEAPIFSTVQPPSSSAMDEGKENVAHASISMEDRDTDRLTKEDQQVEGSHRASGDRAAQSLQSKMKYKSSSVLAAAPVYEPQQERHQQSSDVRLDRSCTQPNRLTPECLPTSEPDESIYQQQLTMTQGHSFDHNKSQHQASQLDHQFQPAHLFSSCQGQAAKSRQTNEATLQQQPPNASTITSLGRANQARFGSKVMHIANKYNIELNPDKQQIFDERDRQSSMITSQTAYLSRGSSPQRVAAASQAQTTQYSQHGQAGPSQPKTVGATNFRSSMRARAASKTMNSSFVSNQARRKNNGSMSSKWRHRGTGSSTHSKQRPQSLLEASKGRSSSNLRRRPGAEATEGRGDRMREAYQEWRKGQHGAQRKSAGRSKTPKKQNRQEAMRSGSKSKSNSVRRCLNAFVVGQGSKSGQKHPRLSKMYHNTLNTQKCSAIRGTSYQRLGNTTQQSTIKACLGAGSKRMTSYDRIHNQSTRQDLSQNDWQPIRLSHGVGQDSRTSLMTAITIKTQGNNQGMKHVSNRKKASGRYEGARGRRLSAAQPANHKKMGSGSLPKRLELTAGFKTRVPSKFLSQSSHSRSKNRYSGANSRSRRKNQQTGTSYNRTSNKQITAKKSYKRDLQVADLYHREAMIRKFFCNWIERFIERLRQREDQELQKRAGHSAPSLPDPIPSTRAALDQAMTRTHSDSRMSLPTNSVREPGPTDVHHQYQQTPQYKVKDCEQLHGGKAKIANFFSQQLVSEDTSQKSPANHISHRKESNWRSKAQQRQHSTLSGDRSSMSVTKSRKSKKSKSSVSDYSKRSRLSRSRHKEKAKTKGKRNLTATNEQILFMDASKSSVPISQSFFDNVASPCSYSAMVQQKARKQLQPASKLHNYLDRQQSFSAEHVGDNRAHNYFISTAEACESMQRDDVIEQLNGGDGVHGRRKADRHATDGTIGQLKSKMASGRRVDVNDTKQAKERREERDPDARWQQGLDEEGEPSRNWFDRLSCAQKRRKSPLQQISHSYERNCDYYEPQNMRNPSQDSPQQELRETAQLGQQMRRNEDLIFPLELSHDVDGAQDKRNSSTQKRPRTGKSRRTQRSSHNRMAYDEHQRKSRLKRGLKILKRYQNKVLAHQLRPRERGRSAKKTRTLTSMSRMSKQGSNSKSRGYKSRSLSKEHSHMKRTKEVPSRISTINHTNASYMPQNSITISDHLAEQKSQKSKSRSQRKTSSYLAGTPPRPRQTGADLRSSKSQASASAKSKSLCSNNRRTTEYAHTIQRSESKQACRTLSRSHQSQTISRQKQYHHTYHSKTGESKKKRTMHSTITVEDISRLKMHKYFLKWVGCVRWMRQHSREKRRNGWNAHHRKHGSPKRSTSKNRSYKEYPDSRKKRNRSHSRSAIATHDWPETLNSCSRTNRLALDPQKALAKEFRRNNLKMRALRILYRSAFNSHRLVVLREHLRQRTRANLITRTFVRWIEAYSERMKQKAWQEWLLKKREDNRLVRAFQGWRNVVDSRKVYRDKVRSVVPMRCLLRLIGQQDHVPPEVLEEQQYIGQELHVCAQFYEMSSVDERMIHDSIMQFQSNLLAAAFQALKPDHLKHPARDFVQSKHRWLTLKRCWDAVLDYSQQRRSLRIKYKHLSMLCQARVKSKMLHMWLQKLQERSSMLRKVLKAGQHFRPRCTGKYFGYLKAYVAHRRAKTQKSSFYRMMHQEKIKRLTFTNFYSMTVKLRDLGVKFEEARAVSREYRRHIALRGWSHVAAKTTKARLLYEWNLKVRSFALQREATIVSQIRNEKKQRAQNYIVEKARRQVFWFLREYCVERKAGQGVKEHNKREAARHLLRRLFLHLYAQCVQRRKIRQISELLQGEFRAKRLQQCWDQLQQNIVDQRDLRDREYEVHLKFKTTMFAGLLYAVRKQQALRAALIDTVQKRNRARADFVLSNWRRLASQQQANKLDLQKRIHTFTVKRAIKKFKLNWQLMKEGRQLEELCRQQHKEHLKHRVWRVLAARRQRSKTLKKRQARGHWRSHLLEICFSALANQALLGRKRQQVQNATVARTRRRVLGGWVAALCGAQVNRMVHTHHEVGLKRRALAALKRFLVVREALEAQVQRAGRHYRLQLLSKYLGKLQIQKQLIDALEQEKEDKEQTAIRHFLFRRLNKWAVFARRSADLKSKAAVVERKRFKKEQRKYLSKMLDVYAHNSKMRLSTHFRDTKVGKKVIKELRAQARRAKVVRALFEDHMQGKANRKVLAAFGALKDHRARRQGKGRQEALALGQLGEFIQRKVFDILLHNARTRRKLAFLSQQLQQRTEALTMARCIRGMLDAYVVQPRLDAVADAYRMQKQFRRFKGKVEYIRDRRLGGRLHEREVKAFRLLGRNLLRKSFTALKVTLHCNALKRQEMSMVLQFQRRRWFGLWRQVYLLRSKANYLVSCQDGAIGGASASAQSAGAPQGYKRGARGLPPKYRQSLQQSHQSSIDAQLQESYYSNPYGRLFHSGQKPAQSAFHSAFPHSSGLAAGAQASTPTLPPPQGPESTIHSVEHIVGVQSVVDPRAVQREGFQNIAKQCQMLSERVQQRLSRRSSQAALEQREMSQGARMVASESDERTDVTRAHQFGPVHAGYMPSGITIVENDSQRYVRQGSGHLLYPSAHASGPDVIGDSQGSPQRSPPKSQPRQRHLQQSASPQKRQLNSSKLHDSEQDPYAYAYRTEVPGGATLHDKAVELAQAHAYQSFSREYPPHPQPGSERTEHSSDMGNPVPRSRSFKKYLEDNSSLARFSKC